MGLAEDEHHDFVDVVSPSLERPARRWTWAKNDCKQPPPMESPRGGRRRRKSSLLDIQNEIMVRRGTTSTTEDRHRQCLARMSWYQDALQQQGVSEADLKALLAAEESYEKTDLLDIGMPEAKQVAEQHKIMAIHKARKILEESLGHAFVPPDQSSFDFLDRCRPPHQYQPKLVVPAQTKAQALQELNKRTNNPLQYLEERQKTLIPPNVPINIHLEPNNPILMTMDPSSDEPDAQMGSIVPEGSRATRGTIVVHCHGCPNWLRVSLRATLVRCPSCRELSPASDRPVLIVTET